MTIAQSLPTLTPYFIVRAIGGGIVVVSAFMFAVDIIMTILYTPRMTQPQISKTGGAI
jgi:cbb3-type cytochrome oxidase subunit 1